MKITNAQISDTRIVKGYRDPILVLDVDADVQEVCDPINTPSPFYRIVPCGPFVAVEYRPDTDSDWSDVTNLGRFNTGTPHHEQLVDVTVVNQHERTSVWEVQMGVRRVGRLLRKHNLPYICKLDQEAGLKGELHWIFENVKPKCFGSHNSVLDCTLPPEQTVLHNGAHLPFCRVHLADHNKFVGWLRSKSTAR